MTVAAPDRCALSAASINRVRADISFNPTGGGQWLGEIRGLSAGTLVEVYYPFTGLSREQFAALDDSTVELRALGRVYETNPYATVVGRVFQVFGGLFFGMRW